MISNPRHCETPSSSAEPLRSPHVLEKLLSLQRIVMSDKECIVFMVSVEQEAVQWIAFQPDCPVNLRHALVNGWNKQSNPQFVSSIQLHCELDHCGITCGSSCSLAINLDLLGNKPLTCPVFPDANFWLARSQPACRVAPMFGSLEIVSDGQLMETHCPMPLPLQTRVVPSPLESIAGVFAT